MSTSIFQSTPNYTFTQQDHIANKKLDNLRMQACKQLPVEYKSQKIITLFDEIRNTQLYSALKTLPKAVMHHVHFDCCEDQDFYAEHVVNDPIVFLDQKMKNFKLGTKQQADKQLWVSMEKVKQKFANQKDFIKYISNITMLNKQQLTQNFKESSQICWKRFEQKIRGFFPILGAAHLFKKYVIYILRKFIKNGYDRIQFRSFLSNLNQYNEKGQIIKVHPSKKFMEVFDEAFQTVKIQHPQLSVGFIFFGLKMLKPEQNQRILMTALQQKWSKTIGIDFVQHQDPYGSQVPYDQVANKVLSHFPELNIKKVYHAGQTVDHLNQNVQISIKAGSARIGHGINVLQHPQILSLCREKLICFQQSPLSNLVLGYVKDPRSASSQLLLGLGIPLTINPDDPARFGVQDCTMDYYITYISSNWSLCHLKLVAIHSINHAICSEDEKRLLLVSFNNRWNEWVNIFIKQ